MTTENIKICLRHGNPPTERYFTHKEFEQHVLMLMDKALYRAAADFALQVARALPQDTSSRLLAAQALLLDHRPEQAIEITDQALELLDHPAPAHLIKARIALQLNRKPEVIEHLNAALSTGNDQADIHCECGDIYVSIGDFEQARSSFLKAIELNIRYVSSLLKLSQLPGQDINDELLKRMEFLVQSKQLSHRDQMYAHFSLAYIYDNRSDIPNHFRHLHAGNKINCKSYNFDTEAHNQQVKSIINFFDAQFFSKFQPLQEHSEKIIFIVGLPRSGSTLTEQILSSHPEVCGAGENSFMINAIHNFSGNHAGNLHFPQLISENTYEKLPLIGDDYLNSLQPLKTSPIVVDKTLGNYNLIGLLILLFPKAKFIHVKRHPIATLYGCYKRLFSRGSIPYSYSLDHLAAVYKDYRSLMKHWDEVLPGKIFTLEYESLVTDQEHTSRKLLEYCELSWNESCLNFHKNTRSVTTSSNAQVKQKLYSSAVDQWKNYIEYIQPLMELIEGPENNNE